jgi:hypothetical protein
VTRNHWFESRQNWVESVAIKISLEKRSCVSSMTAKQLRSRRPGGDRGCNVGDRPKQDQWIILRRNKSASRPKARGLAVDSVNDQRASADELPGSHTALQRMLEQPSANFFADPIPRVVPAAGRERDSAVGRCGSTAAVWRARWPLITSQSLYPWIPRALRARTIRPIRAPGGRAWTEHP